MILLMHTASNSTRGNMLHVTEQNKKTMRHIGIQVFKVRRCYQAALFAGWRYSYEYLLWAPAVGSTPTWPTATIASTPLSLAALGE